MRVQEIAHGVYRMPILFVNVYFVGEPGGEWFLVDTGLKGFSGRIRKVAESIFGPKARPQFIILTHGHFDHAGSARALARRWNVPIYVHPLEIPYLSGHSGYPPPDPTVGGCFAQLSRFMSSKPLDLGQNLQPLEEVEGMPKHLPGGFSEWNWVHTPGHAPGQISLFRESDRTLLAGDALATMNMDSYFGMITARRKLARAGSPFNTNWDDTLISIAKVAELKPYTIAAGHGKPMAGEMIETKLQKFARDVLPPAKGRYVFKPAVTNFQGVVNLPPRPLDPMPKVVMTMAAFAAIGYLLSRTKRKHFA